MEETTIRNRLPGDADPRLGRVHRQRDGRAWRSCSTDLGLASARIGIEMDYLPAGDFAALQQRAAEARRSAPAEAALARLAADQDAGGDRAAAPALAHRRRVDHRRVRGGRRPATPRWTSPPHMTRGIYAHGAEQFRLMIVATGERSVFPNVGPTERKLAAAGRLPRRDLLDDQRLSGRRLPHRGGAAPPPHAERIWAQSRRLQISDPRHDQAGRELRARSTRRSSRKLSELDLPPISFVGHGIGLHLHEDPYLGKVFRHAARSRHGARHRAAGLPTRPTASACRTRTWCWSPTPAPSCCPTTPTPTSSWW